MAEYEVRRIAEITQQTLRFYRQTTLPARTKMKDLLDSVLSLYQGRFNSLNLQVERDYDPELDLFCFAGEIRQVFANLVGNSIDASIRGGRLRVRARRSRNWKDPARPASALPWPTPGRAWSGKSGARFRGLLHNQGSHRDRSRPLDQPRDRAKHHGIFRVRSRTVLIRQVLRHRLPVLHPRRPESAGCDRSRIRKW